MIPIVLLGDKNDTKTGRLLCERLCKNAEVMHISGGSVSLTAGRGRSFAVYEPTEDICDLKNMKKGIVMIKENIGTLKGMILSESVSVIVGSDNYKALKIIPPCCKRVVTCGMSARDTLSLSANAGGFASVSLQRKIRNIYGRWVHERELPLKDCGGIGSYNILMLTAVKLICEI